MGAGGSRPINNQSKVVLVKGSDEGKTIDFVTASSASEERKDDRDSPDDESIVQPFTSFGTVHELREMLHEQVRQRDGHPNDHLPCPAQSTPRIE